MIKQGAPQTWGNLTYQISQLPTPFNASGRLSYILVASLYQITKNILKQPVHVAWPSSLAVAERPWQDWKESEYVATWKQIDQNWWGHGRTCFDSGFPSPENLSSNRFPQSQEVLVVTCDHCQDPLPVQPAARARLQVKAPAEKWWLWICPLSLVDSAKSNVWEVDFPAKAFSLQACCGYFDHRVRPGPRPEYMPQTSCIKLCWMAKPPQPSLPDHTLSSYTEGAHARHIN